MLDVLLLLSVAGWLLESFDNEGRSRGNYRYGSLTILDSEPDGDTKSFLLRNA